MTQPTPTLISDIIAAADSPCLIDARCDRLRDAAKRMLRAIAHEQANAGVNEWHDGAANMLAYIVYGTGPLADLADPLPGGNWRCGRCKQFVDFGTLSSRRTPHKEPTR